MAETKLCRKHTSSGLQWLAVMLCSALQLSPCAARGGDWEQWRGPRRDATVTTGPQWPTNLDGLELAWRVPLGKGYPGPIVAADRVFVVETVDDGNVAVRALGRDHGEVIWRTAWAAGGSVPFFARRNGDWVRSTPVYDGETLYAGDMQEVLVALDGRDGDERWRVDFPQRYGTRAPDFGFASSPLVDGDHLYVQAANSLVKLDKRTGESQWRTLEASGDMAASGAFSSPVIATLGGERQLVVLTRHALYGVDLGDGGVLWSQRVPSFRGMNILTPLIVGDAIFTSPYKRRSYLFRLSSADRELTVEEAWTYKGSGYMSSPVVAGGDIYIHLGNGRLDCLDPATGESRWRTSESLGDYWSMVAKGNLILALDDAGTLRLIRANRERYELLAEREVSEQETWGHLAVAGDEIYVRELGAIAAFRWR